MGTLKGEGTEQTHTEKVVQDVIDRLHDMNMDVAGGESAVPALLIVRKVA